MTTNCKICGEPTVYEGTKLCNYCYEMERTVDRLVVTFPRIAIQYLGKALKDAELRVKLEEEKHEPQRYYIDGYDIEIKKILDDFNIIVNGQSIQKNLNGEYTVHNNLIINLLEDAILKAIKQYECLTLQLLALVIDQSQFESLKQAATSAKILIRYVKRQDHFKIYVENDSQADILSYAFAHANITTFITEISGEI